MISLHTESSPDIHSKPLEFERDPLSIVIDKICEFFKGLWETLVALFSSEKKLTPIMTALVEEDTGSENEETDVISEVFQEVQKTIYQEIKNENSDLNLTRMIKQGYPVDVQNQQFQRSNQPYTEDTQYNEEVEKIKSDLKTKVETTFSNPALQKAVLAAFSRDLFLQEHEERTKALLSNTPLLGPNHVLQPYDDENNTLDAKSGITSHTLSDKRVYIKKQEDTALVEIHRKFHIQDENLTDTGRSIEIIQTFNLNEKGTVSNLGIGSTFF